MGDDAGDRPAREGFDGSEWGARACSPPAACRSPNHRFRFPQCTWANGRVARPGQGTPDASSSKLGNDGWSSRGGGFSYADRGFTAEPACRILPTRVICHRTLRVHRSHVRPLRAHQRALANLVAAIARGEATGVTDILAAVTPGGGKSLLPVIAAAHLIKAGIVERICWVVPRDSLRLQAEEAFADPALARRARPRPRRCAPPTTSRIRAAACRLRHHLPGDRRRPRTAPRRDPPPPHPARGRRGAPSPDPVGVRIEPAPSAGQAPARTKRRCGAALSCRCSNRPPCACSCPAPSNGPTAGVSCGCPTGRARRPERDEVDLEAPGWAVIGYSRAQAVAERAVLPVTFGALDGEASWLQGGRTATRGDPARTAPPLGPLPDRDHAPGPVHGAPNRLCPRAAAGGVPGDPQPARPPPGGAEPGRRRVGPWPRQAPCGRPRPAQRPALLRDAAGLDAIRPGRARGAARDLRRARCAGGAGGLPVDRRARRSW